MSEPAPLLQPLKPAAVPPRLWNGARFVPDDWRTIADDEALPIEGHAMSRWRAGAGTRRRSRR